MLYGTTNWTVLAQHMIDPDTNTNLRSGQQCRERWHNHLNPNISKVEWTMQEDATIVYLQKQWGNQWAKIAKYLPGRSDNAVKNRYHATCRSKFTNADLADLNLPIFVEDAQAVVEAPAPRAGSVSSSWSGSGKTSKESEYDEEYGSEEELDFDQHVQKIKNYTSTLAVPVPGVDNAQYLRDDIAGSPLTNTSMSLGELALDELMESDDEGEAPHQGGMGGFTNAIAVEPLSFASYQWGSNQFDSAASEPQSNSCMSNNNGFCGQWSAPAVNFSSSMASMCDFSMGMGGSADENEFYADAQPAFVCDVVDAAPAQQQQQHFFSPSMAFCSAPRR